MKRLFLTAILIVLCIFCFGQEGGPLKFLGIPIDGTEAQFGAKLRSKGFLYNSVYDYYTGQFNGKKVNVFLHTNHNVMDRVYVVFPETTESDIRIEYNKLISQFRKNGKYDELDKNEEIPDDENISYEITVKNKRYQASFVYFDPSVGDIARSNALLDKFSPFLTEEQIVRLKGYVANYDNMTEKEKEELPNRFAEEIQKEGLKDPEISSNPEKALLFLTTFFDGIKSQADGDVWFMIFENYGKYYIGLYYDNLHNRPNGEDL